MDETKPQTNNRKSGTTALLEQLKIDPLTFLDPKLPSGYFSHSQYGAYKICAYNYFLDRVQKRTKKFNKTGNMAAGTALHAGNEYTLLAKMADETLSLEAGLEVVSKSYDKEAADVEIWEEDAPTGLVKDRALKLYRVFYALALPKINPVAVEKGFAVKFGDVPMIGWIDLVDEQPALAVGSMPPDVAELSPKKLVTVDFKTGKAKWSENELRKDTQLTMYAATQGTPDIRVDQFITLKNGPQYVRGESERTPDDTAVFTEDVNETADLIKKGIFPKTSIDSWKCNEKFCPFWADCRGKKGK